MPAAASAEGTRRYARRAINQGIPASAYRGLGRTGLVNSSLGFGSYRIDDRTPEHASALDKALRSGVNLIDTSTNYTDGSSESCIGNVLARQQREELIVVSKVGYVQGQALLQDVASHESGRPWRAQLRTCCRASRGRLRVSRRASTS